MDIVLASGTGSFLSELPVEAEVFDLHAKRVSCSIPGLIRYLKKRHPVSLLAFQDHAGVAAILARAVSGIDTRIVPSVHIAWSCLLERCGFKQRLLGGVLRFAYRHADAVVAVSHGAAADMVSAVGVDASNVRVIYNPVVSPELFAKSAQAVDHPWFKADEPPVVVGIGRLERQKNFPLLLRAFGHVRTQLPIRLLILGEGRERSVLEALVHYLGLQQDVWMPGFVANPYPYLRRAAMFVLSSDFEGLPTALTEALALGVPAIATNCKTGPAEILQDGRYGLLVPVGDVEALGAAMLATLRGPTSRVPAEAWQPYTYETVTDAYAQLLAPEFTALQLATAPQ